MKQAVVLSSGGLDSTTVLAWAVKQCGKDNVVALTLYYGQRHDKELECARSVSAYYGVRHIEEDISNVMKYAGDVCSLIKDSNIEIENSSYETQVNKSETGRVNSYVPFRNGLLLSIAAAYAECLFPEGDVAICYGAHADDAAGNAYADCSPRFIGAMNEAIKIGTYGRIEITAPFAAATKANIVSTGLRLEVPYELTWSCYHGGEKACGVCGTCIDRLRAFEANGVEDPIMYEDNNE